MTGMFQFQMQCQGWQEKAFGELTNESLQMRAMRFLEEAVELFQTAGLSKEKANEIVAYTFGRPVGDPCQEVGGVMVTLAAFCNAGDISLENEAWREFIRIDTPEMIQKIRDKQVSKPGMPRP